jgi:hypothetical protein
MEHSVGATNISDVLPVIHITVSTAAVREDRCQRQRFTATSY